jgi:hypothetical protein
MAGRLLRPSNDFHTPAMASKKRLLVALLLSTLCGCPSAGQFQGRLFIVNATGGVLRSIVLDASAGGFERRFAFPEIANGQAWILDPGGLSVLNDKLTLSYVDGVGQQRSIWVPFGNQIPDHGVDDFLIEIGRYPWHRSGLLAYRNYNEHRNIVMWTHILAGAAGLLLGRLCFRRRRLPDRRSGTHARPAADPNLG